MYKDRITVQRKTLTGRSNSGDNQYGPNTTVYQHLKCDIQDGHQRISERIVLGSQGTTPVCTKYVTIPGLWDIRVKDIVIDEYDSSAYLVSKVLPRKVLPHVEIEIQGGVL